MRAVSVVTELTPLDVRAVTVPTSAVDDARTIEVTFSTGAAVERFDWYSGKRYLEKLSLDPKHIRLARLNDGAPLLDSHSGWSVKSILGAAVPGTAKVDGRSGTATVQFSGRDEVTPIWKDVRAGLIRNVSIGYRVYKFEEEQGKSNALPVRTAIDWEPFEISMVPMPADAGAKTRSEGEKTGLVNRCEIVHRGVDLTLADADRFRGLGLELNRYA